jgi:hypothetical protein
MKKLFILAAFTACAFASHAQDNGGGKKLSFSAGIEAALPMGDFGDVYSMGIGASAQGAYALSDKAGITLNAGYISYSGKSIDVLGTSVKADALNVIPVMAGLKYGLTDKIYAHGQAGMSFWSSGDVSESDFTWNIGVGYNITNNIDVALKYNSIGTEGSASNAVGLRVAYNF